MAMKTIFIQTNSCESLAEGIGFSVFGDTSPSTEIYGNLRFFEQVLHVDYR